MFLNYVRFVYLSTSIENRSGSPYKRALNLDLDVHMHCLIKILNWLQLVNSTNIISIALGFMLVCIGFVKISMVYTTKQVTLSRCGNVGYDEESKSGITKSKLTIEMKTIRIYCVFSYIITRFLKKQKKFLIVILLNFLSISEKQMNVARLRKIHNFPSFLMDHPVYL